MYIVIEDLANNSTSLAPKEDAFILLEKVSAGKGVAHFMYNVFTSGIGYIERADTRWYICKDKSTFQRLYPHKMPK